MERTNPSPRIESLIFRAATAVTFAIVALAALLINGQEILSWETLAVVLLMASLGIIVSSLYIKRHGRAPGANRRT